MGIRSMPRKPVELFQHRPTGCTTCVTAQVLYVFGRTKRPDPVAVDRAAGLRSLDEPLPDSDAHFYLLRQGFKQVSIGDFDVQLFLKHGKPYLKKSYGDEWTAEHEAFFTPAKVAEIQQLDLAHVARLQPYLRRKALRDLNRVAVRDDVSQLLKTGYAVDGTFDNGLSNKRRVQHAVLLVPCQQKRGGTTTVWAYHPCLPDSGMKTVWRLSLKEALDWVRYDKTITGIKF